MSIKPEALEFLQELKVNNNRDWFQENRPRFKRHETAFKDTVSEIRSLMERHDLIDRTKVFRIYRDVRFSKDKTPYKHHFAASFSRLGEDKRGGYYMRISPGESFIAAGFWDPNKEDLFRIRKEWEMDADPLRTILADASFRDHWGDLQGEQLKRAPKGFRPDDPNIDLIRYKQFIFTRELSDEELVAKDFINRIDSHFQAIRPFFDLMSEVLTTNLNGESILGD
jgi:uncharacterized protein (TIGR02453 family)